MESLLESLFEFLFKYRPVVFEKGHLAFGVPRAASFALLAGLVVAVPVLLSYARVKGKSSRRDRVVLGLLRGAALALLVVCLFRPTLVVSEAVPQRNVVGVLIDDSRSMGIADEDGRPRADFVRRTFADEQSPLVAALSERFLVRFFRFSRDVERMAGASELSFSGRRSHLGGAMQHARQELSGVPLAGLVVVTDGADNSQLSPGAAPFDETIRSLAAASVPVYTVGVGRETFDRDIEISRVEAPRSVLKGTLLAVDVVVVQSGYGGESVPLIVEDSGRVVSTQQIALPPDGQAAPVRVHVPASAAGARPFRFRIPPQSGEMIAENNQQDALVAVSGAKEKILYIEGEPRPEMKFIGRAVRDDQNLQLVTLLRTAENKFLRQGVDDSLELVAGFPKTREELFGYRGVILGSIEASFFTVDQLRMLADFVSERGGGLLMLGGRRTFAEGRYGGTPLADVLPVVLDPPAEPGTEADTFFVEMRVEPTPAGASHAAMQIAGSESRSAARWKELPPLTSVNRVRALRPGATALLTGSRQGSAERVPVLAYQRYGRGKAITFVVQDSWFWQMDASISVEDMTHEILWRQLLRWLVADVPGQVGVTPARDRVAPREVVGLRAAVHDDMYVRMNNAEVSARVTSPSGASAVIPMEWAVDVDGEYRASFTPEEEGIYEVHVTARRGEESLPAATAYVHAGELEGEFFEATLRSALLKRVARETGGRYYTAATAGSLPKDIVYTESGTTTLTHNDLWDMPVLFLLLLGLVGAEWGYRRARGLA